MRSLRLSLALRASLGIRELNRFAQVWSAEEESLDSKEYELRGEMELALRRDREKEEYGRVFARWYR